jgi:hypothetical protein
VDFSLISKRLLAAGLGFVAIVAVWMIESRVPSTAAGATHYEAHRQAVWVACNRNANSSAPSTFHPLSDHVARLLVTHVPEIRPDNARPFSVLGVVHQAPNDYRPTAAQIASVRGARTASGQSILAFNPYYRYVDGHDGLHRPSTDDLIQWAAHKWGIPEDWLRAEYVHETYWNHYFLGDDTRVPAAWSPHYPYQARVPGSTTHVYQSMGITQVRWTPDGYLNAGTEPLRWLSAAFSIDWQAATLRFYYDNPGGTRSSWGDKSYHPCEKWNSIGGWYRPYPWDNSDQQGYVRAVQGILAARTWTSQSFIGWSPSSLPPMVKLR